MTWNPLSTLTGRLVLVTFGAVIVASMISVIFYSSERGTELRSLALNSAAERIAFNVERLRETPPPERPALAEHFREVFIRYSVDSAPALTSNSQTGAAQRVARLLSARLQNTEVRVQTRVGASQTRMLVNGGEADSTEGQRRVSVPLTLLTVSVKLDEGSWLNARGYLPGPSPAPTRALLGFIALLIAVGLGAALVARQIGKPLAQLADAAQALGAGQSHVTAPVSGPDDVRRASKAFNGMAERLGRQLQRQRQMLWALSHDLRTPITALRLRAELVEDEATRQRLLGPIHEMELLTEQALELARAGASEEERATVDLGEIAQTLCGELQDMGVDVHAEVPQQPVMVTVRPSEIARALRNLAENAAKYAGKGAMRIRRNAMGEAVAEISDEGPGVAPEMLSRLAEPFFRADAARGDANGAGLGLSIVQAITDSHGGRLILQNRAPHGFSATLILPA